MQALFLVGQAEIIAGCFPFQMLTGIFVCLTPQSVVQLRVSFLHSGTGSFTIRLGHLRFFIVVPELLIEHQYQVGQVMVLILPLTERPAEGILDGAGAEVVSD